jgi:YqaJ-like viral recombinase domain
MALNAAQVARRAGKLTASRIACLMTGDAFKIDLLYREMIGETLPEDLSDVWPVQLGECTEQLQLNWYERKARQIVNRRGEVVIHPTLPWAACTLDGWINELSCPIEVKHVGGREPIEVLIERYSPQVQWLMECTGTAQCAFSIIFGANEPVVDFLERDATYAAEMVKRGEQFMSFVERRIPPVVLPPVPAPILADKSYDMSGRNEWTNSAVTWLITLQSARDHDDAAKILKSLVPADAKKAHGAGVAITRNRAGSLSLREMKE